MSKIPIQDSRVRCAVPARFAGLAIVALALIFGALTLDASAATNPYAACQCTARVFDERQNNYNDILPSALGDALNWGVNLRAAGYLPLAGPMVGAIVVWQPGVGGAGPSGHVAIVRQMNADGTFMVAESNWPVGNCDPPSRKVARVTGTHSNGRPNMEFIGFKSAPASWSVTLTASSASLPAGATVTLTARVNKDLGPTPYWAVLKYSGGVLGTACGAGTTCTWNVRSDGPGSFAFTAVVSDQGGNNVQASSIPLTVAWTSAPAPAPTPPPASRPTITIDDRSSGFSHGGSFWRDSTYGLDGHSFWTFSNLGAVDSWCEWKASVSGRYRVLAYVPRADATTRSAKYKISHRGGTATVTVDQNGLYDQFADLGTYDFDAGDTRRVRLDDATGEASGSTRVNCDAVRFEPR